MRLIDRRLLPIAVSLALAGCQWLPTTQGADSVGLFSVDVTPVALTEPNTFDWTFHRVSGKHLAAKREAHIERQLLAYPSATDWNTAGVPGVSLTTMGAGAGDTMPNAAAAVFATKTTPKALHNKVFILTKGGKLIRVDRADTADFSTLALGKTFTRTFVTLSPSAMRAYVVADDGTFFIVNTQTMTIMETLSLGATALGCAPVFDPYSAHDGGGGEDIYIPDNAGYVNKYRWENGALVGGKTAYAVATSTAPTDGGTAKIEAPAVVLNGVIYVGDQGGAFHAYDTVTPANNAIFFTGSPIDTAPAIEIQDGSYSVTDVSGNPKVVARGTPVFAFVTSGANCFWMNLHNLRSYRSVSLYLDDFTPTKQFGYLRDYTYNNSTEDKPVTLTDWCAIRTDNDTVLAGAAAGQNKTKNWIAAGELDATYESSNKTTAGGPVVCYLKFSTGTSGTSIVKEAELELTVEKGGWTKLPEFRVAESSFLKGTSTVWDYASLTNANRPGWEGTDVGNPVNFGVNGNGNTQVNSGNRLIWDLSEGFNGTPASDYTLVFMYNQGGKVYWEPGEQNGDNGQNANIVEGTRFRTPSDTADKQPVFRVKTTVGSFPSPTIETPPVIDVWNKKVYVFYCNALYAISFASTDAFEDRDAATKTTLFNSTRLGRDATIGGVAYAGGAAYAPGSLGDTKFVNNKTAPAFNYNLTYAYLLDRFPETPSSTAPTAWDYGVSKIRLADLVAGADGLQKPATALPFINNVPGEASNFMIVDPFTDAATTGGNVIFGLGDGKVYQFDR